MKDQAKKKETEEAQQAQQTTCHRKGNSCQDQEDHGKQQRPEPIQKEETKGNVK